MRISETAFVAVLFVAMANVAFSAPAEASVVRQPDRHAMAILNTNVDDLNIDQFADGDVLAMNRRGSVFQCRVHQACRVINAASIEFGQNRGFTFNDRPLVRSARAANTSPAITPPVAQDAVFKAALNGASTEPAAQIPTPAAAPLFITALIGFVLARRARLRRAR